MASLRRRGQRRRCYPLGLKSSAASAQRGCLLVSTRQDQVVEYLFDGAGFGRRSGHHAHAERQARDVHADDALGTIDSTIGTALVVEGYAPIGGSSCKVGVYDHHRGPRVLST